MFIGKYPALLLLLAAPFSFAQETPKAESTTRAVRTDSLHVFDQAVEGLAQRVSGSVVQVFTTGYSLNDRDAANASSVLSPERGTGAGIILTSDGYIMTNAHVIQSARKIRVMLN